MNCKQGDLALTFGAPMDNGLLVEVLEPFRGNTRDEYGPCWLVRSLGSPFHIEPHLRGQRCAWPDKLLTPIRDPGEGSTDETLQRLPAPSLETA